ncbi:lipopolysaccharide biosynthesis [Paracoccus caeni]|uniref:Lipopolysaccharide biosynthesis n=1 Tax=Paracoccus caeni TaxID=657651 RepID=A0A934SPN3_9RHOB|nr:lipopolysaccharide biosynthesis [Paracoccus caeni]MBK4218143.1 lipopolysaccharide biosynthesis [Paracoccus caeni]
MIDLRFYWSLLLRRLPIMLALLIICTVFGLVSAVRAPSTYFTAARLLVEGAQIPEGSGDAMAAGEMLQIIEQRLMTRANMIDVANKLDVFSSDSSLSVDQKVAEMMTSTTVRRFDGRDQATLMTVGFTSTNPRMTAAVVNEFTTLILSANTRTRVGLAEDRLSFYQQEVDRLGQDLDAQTARILDFKRENADSLPENLRYRQDRQSLLQERVSRLESDLAALQSQRADMVRIFEQTGSIGVSNAPQSMEQQQLAALQAELNSVLGVYAEDSARVKALRNRIALAERNVGVATGSTTEQSGNSLLDLNLAQIDSRVSAINTELAQSNQELDRLAESINATAAIAITLGAMERDQANIQTRYDAAVSSLGQARTAERVEASSRGERITVIEAASVPSLPSGPNRKKIALMGVALGMGLAGGFFVLMELLNSAIRRPAEMRSRFQITPLAVIPYIESRQERRRRQSVGMAATLAVLIIIPLGLWVLHVNYMPLDILTQKIVGRLGLG